MDNYDEIAAPRAPPLGRRSAIHVGLEVFSIVLGVLLALAVSEWQDNRNNLERTNAALRNVRIELTKNLELLEIVHARNVDLVELLNGDSEKVDQDAQFLPALQITDSAWQTLGSTGLGGYVDFNLMVTLSQTYSLIEVYRRSSYSLLDANLWVLATATATERDMKTIEDKNLFAKNFISQFQLIINIESALIDAHQNAISKLDPDT
jgi:hypothetical protein